MKNNRIYSGCKAILSLLLCCAVVLGFSPCQGFSEEGEASVPTETTAAGSGRQIVQTSAASADKIDGYGDLLLDLTSGELKELGA